MTSFATWRGQVPAWQCDADGLWNTRHVAGAFDEARRVAASVGFQADTLELSLLPPAGPKAGELVEIVTNVSSGRITHVMHGLNGGRELYRALSLQGQPTDFRPLDDADHAARGPLNIVNAWECDVMGHMNVQFYASRLTEAEALFSARPGAGSNSMPPRPSEQRFRFLGEIKADEIVRVRTVGLAKQDRALTLRTELVGGSGRAALMESDLPFDPAFGSGEGGGNLSDIPSLNGEAPLWTGGDWSPDAATLPGMTVLGRQEVQPWEVDHTGVMPPRFYFARMASSVPFLMNMMGLDRPFMLSQGFGRAAVGYRLRYLRWAKPGDCLELRSGVGDVRDKNWRFRHCFVDISDGGIIAVVEAVVVLFDLAARRTVALPEAIKSRATAISI